MPFENDDFDFYGCHNFEELFGIGDHKACSILYHTLYSNSRKLAPISNSTR